MLVGLDHFNLSTQDMRGTLSFFERLFGLTAKAAPGQDPARNSWLHDRHGNAIVHVNLRRHAGEDGPINHVAFACEDYDAMRDRIVQEGLDIVELDNRATTGCRQIFTRSPEGARIELNFRDS